MNEVEPFDDSDSKLTAAESAGWFYVLWFLSLTALSLRSDEEGLCPDPGNVLS